MQKSSCSLCKRLQRNRKGAFRGVSLKCQWLFVFNHYSLISGHTDVSNREIICLPLRAGPGPHLPKSRFDPDKGGRGSHWRVRDWEAWTMSIQALKHLVSVFLFPIKIDVLKSVDCQLQKTKWQPTPEGCQTSTGERTLPMFFLKCVSNPLWGNHFQEGVEASLLELLTEYRFSTLCTCKKFIKHAQ